LVWADASQEAAFDAAWEAITPLFSL
jgi:hypothetical protein